MFTHLLSLFSTRNGRVFTLGAACVVSSFAVGIQTAGDVQPVTLIEAGSVVQSGDVTGDGLVDVQDVVSILEVAQGYEEASPSQLKADPNGDGQLTIDDAIRLLATLSY